VKITIRWCAAQPDDVPKIFCLYRDCIGIARRATYRACSHPGSRNPHREAIKYRPDGSPLIGPEKRKKKAIRTARCLSEASFGLFRFFLSIAGIGQSSGSPFLWLLSFGEAKESDCPAA
jgi:hypothetical protein